MSSTISFHQYLILLCSDVSRISFAEEVDTALAKFLEAPHTISEGEEDSEEWLHIDAKDFDDMLQRTYGKKEDKAESMNFGATSTAEEDATQRQANRLMELASKVESFVEGEGDMEGVRFGE